MTEAAVERAGVVDVFRVLHLGCGRVGKNLQIQSPAEQPVEIITVDRAEYLQPDLVRVLGVDPLGVAESSIDLVVARQVLEHIGKQGEADEWFKFWEDLYLAMKPGGRVEFESPLFSSVWAWADPTHTRALSEEAFLFFNQDAYRIHPSGISPYRIHCDFVATEFQRVSDSNAHIRRVEGYSHLRGVLTARKPFRPWWGGA